jgi:hypothetical protein
MPGPFDRAHTYLQWGGTLPGNEQWTCGLRLAPPVAVAAEDLPTHEEMQALIEDTVGAIVTTYFSSANAGINANIKLTFVKFNVIKTDGLYRDAATAEQVFTPLGGGVSGLPLPNQIALAISTCTAFTRGPAHRGRWYSPSPATSIDVTTGLISQAYADQVATAAWGYVTALNTALFDGGTGPQVAVMSRKDLAPATRFVTSIEVGRVLDTQRRRRRSIPEMYEVASA